MTTDELLFRMATVLWNGSTRQWNARAKGCSNFANGATPREAMEKALAIWDDEL